MSVNKQVLARVSTLVDETAHDDGLAWSSVGVVERRCVRSACAAGLGPRRNVRVRVERCVDLRPYRPGHRRGHHPRHDHSSWWGIIRDVLLGALPPATFVDWRYLAVAAGGGLIAFMFSRWLTPARFTNLIDVLDAAGLSLFAVTGAVEALELGVGPAQAIILGAVTGVAAERSGTY